MLPFFFTFLSACLALECSLYESNCGGCLTNSSCSWCGQSDISYGYCVETQGDSCSSASGLTIQPRENGCPTGWEETFCAVQTEGGCSACVQARGADPDVPLCDYCRVVSNAAEPFGICYSVGQAENDCSADNGIIRISSDEAAYCEVDSEAEPAGCTYAAQSGGSDVCEACLQQDGCSFCYTGSTSYCVDDALVDTYCPDFWGSTIATCDEADFPTPAPPTPYPTPAPGPPTEAPVTPSLRCILRMTCGGCVATPECGFCADTNTCTTAGPNSCEGTLLLAADVSSCPAPADDVGGETGCDFGSCADCVASGCTHCSIGSLFGEATGACVTTGTACDIGTPSTSVAQCFDNDGGNDDEDDDDGFFDIPSLECQDAPEDGNCAFPDDFRVSGIFAAGCRSLNNQESLEGDDDADDGGEGAAMNEACQEAGDADGAACLEAMFDYSCDRACPPCDSSITRVPCTDKCTAVRDACPTVIEAGCFGDSGSFLTCSDTACGKASASVSDDNPIVREADNGSCNAGCIIGIVIAVLAVLALVAFLVKRNRQSQDAQPTDTATPTAAATGTAKPTELRSSGSQRQRPPSSSGSQRIRSSRQGSSGSAMRSSRQGLRSSASTRSGRR